MDTFCSGEPFWDTDLTWHNSWPQFTTCFQNTVLVWVPCGWLWLTCPFYIYYLHYIEPVVLTSVAKYLLKLFCCGLLIILCVIDTVRSVVDYSKHSPSSLFNADILAPLLQTATFLLVMVVMLLERKKGLITSGILFFFWFLQMITGIVPFYTNIKLQVYSDNLLRFSLFYIYYCLVVVELFINCFAERAWKSSLLKSIKEKEAIKDNSKDFLIGSFRLLLNGYTKTLTEDDIFELNPREKSHSVVPRFLHNWGHQVTKTRYRVRQIMRQNLLRHVVRYDESDERTRLIFNRFAPVAEHGKHAKERLPKPSLLRALLSTFGFQLLQAQFWKLLYDALTLTNPLLLRKLIDFIEDKTIEDWKGYAYGAILFTSMCFQSLFFHAMWHQSTSLGLRIRACVISAICRKALTINNLSRRESTVGETVNLLSVDTEHVERVMKWLWSTWSSVLQIIISLFLLYNTLGTVMFTGLGLLLLMFPLNGLIMAKLGKYQAELMAQKDVRVKMMLEILSGIKILKLYAWESSFQEKVMTVRDRELAILLRSSLISSILTFSWTVAPYMVSLVTFLTYVYVSGEHDLDPETAFVAISLFNILRFAVNQLPLVLGDVVKAMTSVRRINTYLSQDDLDETSMVVNAQQEDPVVINSASFTWNPTLRQSLTNINLTIREGQLIGVVGQIGAGKSSLVSAILGELVKVKGQLSLKGRIAYVPQQAWIQNSTLQNNILFGKSMNRKLYDRVVKCCALRPDLKILPAGDQTEIGDRGISLSGGQKQRISIARAVYSDADIYLLDDPLSAVDSHAAKHIFDKLIGNTGLLKHKTRVLVTHGVQWLPRVDRVVVMTQGQISEIGSYDELLSHNGGFACFLRTYFLESENEQDEDSEVIQMKRQLLQRLQYVTSEDDTETDSIDWRRRTMGMHGSWKIEEERKYRVKEKTDEVKVRKALIEEEQVEGGMVKWSVFMTVGRAIRLRFVLLILLLYTLYEAAAVTANLWLSMWTDDSQLNDEDGFPANSSKRMGRNNFYLGVYGALGAAQAIFVVLYSVIFSIRSVHASRILHNRLLSSVLNAPMSFFDTTPTGGIVNRCSQDIETVDNELPVTFEMWLDCSLLVLGTVIAISYSTPVFVAVVVPLFIIYFFVQRFYIPTSRQVKRLTSKTRSPISSHFGETVSGASVIRAHGAADRFLLESEKRVDHNQRFAFAGYTANRWLGIRLEFLGNLILLGASMFAVLSRDRISGGLVGLSISYALEITGNLNWLVRMTSDLETELVAVERIKGYTDITSEAPRTLPKHRPGLHWPEAGVVKFVNYSTRYRQGLGLVLRNITCTIKSGEKVGIVGRTGAGKSSLALFRLTEAAGGEIYIDGLDISRIGLHDLRRRLTILPQEPVVFAGSLRENLDPFNQYNDTLVWTALEHAHLKDFVLTLPRTLEHECGEGGKNLSVGQRQLLCLARALLKKTRILILDEATAAVDMETDDLIQQTIRSEFKDCTVLTIAHRLNTLRDYDRILVLDNGKVAEFDTPQTLIQNPNGIFYKMAKHAGLT